MIIIIPSNPTKKVTSSFEMIDTTGNMGTTKKSIASVTRTLKSMGGVGSVLKLLKRVRWDTVQTQ